MLSSADRLTFDPLVRYDKRSNIFYKFSFAFETFRIFGLVSNPRIFIQDTTENILPINFLNVNPEYRPSVILKMEVPTEDLNAKAKTLRNELRNIRFV